MAGFAEVLLSPFGLGLATVVAAFLVLHFLYSHAYGPSYRVLQRCGIPVPPPAPFWGNVDLVKNAGWMKTYEVAFRTYGAVAGLYIGIKPMVIISDLEMLKEILVKHFDSFTDRSDIPQLYSQALGIPPLLLTARGSTWKKGRMAISPSFTAQKMRAMVPLLQRSSVTLQEKLEEVAKSDKSVDVFSMYGEFTMEAILAAAFGCEANVQRGEGGEVVDAAKAIFASIAGKSSGSSPLSIINIIFILGHFPFLVILLHWLTKRSETLNYYRTLKNVSVELVQTRRRAASGVKYKDLLQLMLDASVEEKGKERKLSDLEIVSYSITFLLAGYETTANTLAYTSYLLALNPDAQEKLCAEIDEYFDSTLDPLNGSSLYEACGELQYLDMVLQESMRMYPAAPRTLRQCSKTTKIGDVTIPKGTRVHIPISLIHHIPEYWPDPDRFDPERFTAKEKANRPQLAHMPFGWGPRNCVGMRFALMEAKIALIYILRKFKFVRASDTEIPLETVLGITLAPKNGIYLKVEQREV